MVTPERVKEWETKYLQPWISKRKERKNKFTTPSGIEIKTLYTPLDLKGDSEEKIGFTGEYPYTRGLY
ncbi:MAG: methylmalonyl-CoA mutase family protein, partial [Metallosphaera sp.]